MAGVLEQIAPRSPLRDVVVVQDEDFSPMNPILYL